MTPDLPLTKDLVLIGGGHTHALVLRRWGMQPLPGVRLTLINPGPVAAYSGMLPGFVAGHYTRDELDIDLVRLARFAGARLITGAVSAVDVADRRITVPGWPDITYDVASLDVGITSAMPDLPGFAAHAVPAKPLSPFAARWATFLDSTETGAVAVIGGGVAGAELAMAMSHALTKAGRAAQVTLIDRSKILTGVGPRARARLRAALSDLGVVVAEDTAVASVSAEGVHLADGRFIASGFTTGAAGARPHDWQRAIAVDQADGYLAVSPRLQTSDPAVFAVGDCAEMSHAPRPKAGVFAVRQAPVLWHNLRAVLSGRPLRRFDPQRDYLKLISLGAQTALAEKFGTALAAPVLWRWKDRIDRRFMDQFGDLPVMSAPDLPPVVATGVAKAMGRAPMCGGCGAKVAPAVVRDVLGIGDDAAVLSTGEAQQVISTDHLRAFVNDPVRMTRILVPHAMSDIWAMGAAPQAALLSITLPRMAPELQARTLQEITDTARACLGRSGAELVGGHSALGAELMLGLTVTGLCDGPPKTLAGARPGDVLLLTKPLGTGVMLAAEMRGLARGSDVLAAWQMMEQTQGAAAAVLTPARAMTDVTGFGLAGHLGNLMRSSAVGAELDLQALPVLPGVKDLLEQGIRSSLDPDNRFAADAVPEAVGWRADLLYDPQTSGGLLAAVPPDQAPEIVADLQRVGCKKATVIGRITEPAGGLRLLGG